MALQKRAKSVGEKRPDRGADASCGADEVVRPWHYAGLVALILMMCVDVHATGGRNDDVSIDNQSRAESSANSVAYSHSEGAKAHVGDVTQTVEAEGGSAHTSVGDVGSTSSTGDVTVSQRNRRNAPPLYVNAPSSTAECVIGRSAGLSLIKGAASVGGGKIDKPCYAWLQAKMFVEWDMFEIAAKTYCEHKRHYGVFGSQDECAAQIHDGLNVWSMPEVEYEAVGEDEDNAKITALESELSALKERLAQVEEKATRATKAQASTKKAEVKKADDTEQKRKAVYEILSQAGWKE